MLILEAVSGVFQPYPIGYLVDFLQDKRPALWLPWIASPQYRTIALLTSAYIVMAAVRSLGDSLAEVFLARAGRRLGYRLRVTLYAHLQRLSLAFHNRRQTGEMLRRVTSDGEHVETFLIQSLSDIAGPILLLISTLTYLFIRSCHVALLSPVLGPHLSPSSNFSSPPSSSPAR